MRWPTMDVPCLACKSVTGQYLRGELRIPIPPLRRSTDGRAEPQFHWHIEIAPRLAPPAGFELGTGIGVGTLDPVAAATRLRAALPPVDA